MKPDKFFRDWKMTVKQHRLYFRLLTDVYAVRCLTIQADKELLRQLIHQKAFGAPVSAKQIDHLKMFDAFKAECIAIIQDSSLEAQLRQIDQPLIRLRYSIRAVLAKNSTR